jgi:hypothetical protein
MTIEQIEKPDNAPTVSLVEDVNTRPDDVLRLLVGIVNASKDEGFDWGMGVTLHVSGTIVSGELVSYGTFWEEFRAFVKGDGSDAVREMFADTFTDGILGAGAAPAVDDDEAAAPSAPTYIHLRRAAIWGPGGESALAKTLWRGRLSHVSAWSVGTFGS